MKRYILIITIIVLTCMVCVRAMAHDIAVVNSDGVTIYYNWINDNKELEVTYQGDTPYNYGTAYTGNVVLPSSVNYNGTDYPVTAIGENAFFMSLGLNSVTIPNSVKTIGDCAFQLCYNLNAISLGSSVESVGAAAFDNCTALTTVVIPNSVITIKERAFDECI